MKISAIVTYYNASETIERVLNSISIQSLTVDEIIIIDDFSSDFLILNEIIKKFNNVKVIRNKKNLGYPASLNKAISVSKGKYIFIFDDDDESIQFRVDQQLKYLKKGYDMVYSSRNTFVEDKLTNLNLTINSDFSFNKNIIPRYLLSGDTIKGKVFGEFGSCTLALKKKMFNDILGFDERFRRKAEWDFVIRASLKGYKIYGIQEALVNQYKTSGVGDEKSLKMSLKMDKLLLTKHKNYLKQNRIYYTSLFYLKSRTYSFYKQKYIWFLFINLYRLFRIIKL